MKYEKQNYTLKVKLFLFKKIHTILLCKSEPSSELKELLNDRTWKNMVFHIQGSVFKKSDLERAK